MVIIPTEKKFDWNHTPFVLFSIVLINVLVFLAYQSGDLEKFENALVEYKKENYLEIEWPLFEEFLREKGELDKLEEYRELYKKDFHDEVTVQVIMRLDFYRYLRFDRYDYLQQQDVGEWFYKREKINDIIKSTSYYSFGLIPSNISVFKLFSYQFLHGDIMHLLGNMFFLVICGFAVEAAIGRWYFLAFYLLTGIAGGLTHTLFNLNETLPLVGASGAVSGVMAMYLGVFKLKKIEFFYWFFIFVGYFRAPALMILPLYIGKEVYQQMSAEASNVAFMAHAGGFVVGGILTGVVMFFKPGLFNRRYIEEDHRINPYQEKLAKVYESIERLRFESAKKSLQVIMDEHGSNFELKSLRYNLEKVNKGPDYWNLVTNLLKTKVSSPAELEKLERIWLENKADYKKIDEDIIVNLAIRLSAINDPSTAANICDYLLANDSKHSSIGLLAKKLANAFEQINNLPKKKKYDAIAKKMLSF